LTALTLTALLIAGGLLVSAHDRAHAPLPTALRSGLIALTLAAVGFAFVGLVSNTALAESRRAAEAETYPRAEAQARKAIDWAPWSSEGWAALGQAQLQQGNLAAARRSFRKAIDKDPRDWNLWLNLAFASSGRARREAALVAYRLNPLSPEIDQARASLGLPGR
jgi:Tfp pilus assembly protein PilF